MIGVLQRRLRAGARNERGFTLIEVLVAMVAAIVVTAAMGALVVTSVHFSSNLTNRVDANQQGRTAMARITQALNSSCVSSQVAPILATSFSGVSTVSDATHVFFYTAYAPTGSTASNVTDVPNINPSLAEVYLSGGQLLETIFPYASGSAPSATNSTPWTFTMTGSNVKTITLMPAAAASLVSGATGPVFKYYGYSATGGTLQSSSFTTPLSATNAANTSEVSINFQALPTSGYSAQNRGSDISDSVVLRLNPASAATGATNIPCS
jgi:prepilin-type N-terminal cleavage/methylation domain-containing protein